jgi:hypothetical protein
VRFAGSAAQGQQHETTAVSLRRSGGGKVLRTGRRIRSMAATPGGSGGLSRRMGGGGLDDPPLPLYEVASIECGGSSAHSNQSRTASVVLAHSA